MILRGHCGSQFGHIRSGLIQAFETGIELFFVTSIVSQHKVSSCRFRIHAVIGMDCHIIRDEHIALGAAGNSRPHEVCNAVL